jgi:hypothetical protein
MRRAFRQIKTAPDRRRRLLAGTCTAAAHLGLVGALFWLHGAAQPQDEKQEAVPMQVSLLPKPPGPSDEKQAEAGGAPVIAAPEPPKIPTPVITIAAAPNTSDILSESQLAGAARAGEGGGGGGGCDMARVAQQALRRDRLVDAAVADAGRLGKASMLWNGDWVRSGGQDGKGLAAVRQAIMWEVGFSPAACRNQPMHGMVVLSLADGATRFAIGAGEWRWADLLGVKRSAAR